MRPTSNASRSNEKIHLSRHDKKIEQRANDFMDVFKNFNFSPAGHITCMIHLLAPKAVNLRAGDDDFNRKFAQFSNELDLALGKSKKEENKNELKTAIIRLIAESGLPERRQDAYDNVSSNGSTAAVITWLKDVRKEVYRPKMTTRPRSQIITPVQTTTTTTTTAPVIRTSQSYRSMPTPQQVPTGNMMPGYPTQPFFYPNPMPVNQMQQPAPYPTTNYVPAPSLHQVPTAMLLNQGQEQGQVQPYPGTANWPQQQQQQQPWQSQNVAPQGQFLPYPGTMNWPQPQPQQQQQQYFYPPQQNGGPWNSGN
jgi:hypothetical protein